MFDLYVEVFLNKDVPGWWTGVEVHALIAAAGTTIVSFQTHVVSGLYVEVFLNKDVPAWWIGVEVHALIAAERTRIVSFQPHIAGLGSTWELSRGY